VIELLWEQCAIGESISDPALVGNAYYQISKLMEDAGSWADWYGPAKARQFLQKAISNFEVRQAVVLWSLMCLPPAGSVVWVVIEELFEITACVYVRACVCVRI
jgi:hypothetical protein